MAQCTSMGSLIQNILIIFNMIYVVAMRCTTLCVFGSIDSSLVGRFCQFRGRAIAGAGRLVRNLTVPHAVYSMRQLSLSGLARRE